ncbi:2-dehydropantoate 2-reductase [Propioniciclava coleopterorum]|uniref:2-dehydropantoate 2-reductase n=1 Tax=Propioniciclava coleopterorum TaxID=2714937 RepID=A0A6G7Y6G1_9ACTN|nr:2-dehydropantoate 2-reductase [Propioniciclava coleopterorum]QIK72484.1 2-dehydropantoate 2-reductase [Propioniciclava coleopterorum]
MRFCFLGAGALGTYVGGSLAAAGHEVGFIEQPGPAGAIAANGLSITTRAGTRRVHDVRLFTDSVMALDAAPWDVLVVALKSFDTAGALRDLQATGLPIPTVLSLQNGVDNEPLIRDALGADRVIAGAVATAIAKPGLGAVVEETHRGIGIALGNPLSAKVVRALDHAGLGARAYPEAGPMKWSKLMTNLQGNASSAILDLPVAAIYADDRLYAMEVAALRETVAVMAAQGFKPVDLPGTPVRALGFGARRVPRAILQPVLVRLLGDSRGDKMPSFHIDLHGGRGRTEVDYINGAVVRHGERFGVPTPVNRVLTTTLEALSAGTLDIERFRHNPDALLALLP